MQRRLGFSLPCIITLTTCLVPLSARPHKHAFSTVAADQALSAEAAGRHNRVISMSLYGTDPDYAFGAIENAVLTKRDWSGWTLRIYHDQNVASDVLRVLRDLDVDLVPRHARPNSGQEPMFWRFDVITDANVTRFIIRDCDARLSGRDRAAVDEWVRSRQYAHIIRDHPQHAVPIMGGMWGSLGGYMPPLTVASTGRIDYQADQTVLRDKMWPTLKQHALVHDAYFCGRHDWRGALWRPFPVKRTSVHDFVGNKYMAANKYVGMEVEKECPVECRGDAAWEWC